MEISYNPRLFGKTTERDKYFAELGCKHTKCPEGYIGWHMWAEKKVKTHKQERCPKCGLWAIWKRKK